MANLDLSVHEDDEPISTGMEPVELKEFVCDRCGYHYKKATDYEPFLCYRCMRFISKKVWTVIHTIQPPTSRTVVAEV